MQITLIITGIVVALIFFLVFQAKRKMAQIQDVKESEKVQILTDQNFIAKTKNGIILIDFWASWCMPCKLMVPVLNELAEATDGKVTIAKLNVDEAKATAAKFKVRSIPTLVLMKNGKEIHRFVGVKTKDYLVKELERRTIFS